MAKQLFTNNATGQLDTSINASDTSIVLKTGQGSSFPNPTNGDWFLVTLYDGNSVIEICKCTARSTDTLTVVRAQESTTASSFATGSICELRATKGTFENFVQVGDSLSVLTAPTADYSMGSHKLTNLATPTTSNDAATKDYVDSTASNASNITSGVLAVAYGGTGQTTANAAFNALVPTQSGNSGKFLTTNGTNTSWVSISQSSSSATETLTNKTINLASNTLSGTKAQFNTACSDGDFLFDGGALGTPASGNLSNCTLSNNYFATSGYQKFPGGLIIQWGESASIWIDTATTVSFATAFPNACLNVSCTAKQSDAGKDTQGIVISFNNTTATLARGGGYGANESNTLYYIAIGY